MPMSSQVTEETFEQAADRAAAAGDFVRARIILEEAVEADATSRDLWIKLSAMRKASGDLRGALAAIERALAISPLEFSCLLYRAVLLEALGDPMAGEEYGNALAQAPPDADIAEPMRPAVARARKRWELHQAALEKHL